MEISILLFGAIGHIVLWVALINRVHAFGIPRRWVNWLTIFFLAMLCFSPLAVAAALYLRSSSDSSTTSIPAGIAWVYVIICAAVAVISIAQRLMWTRHTERAASCEANHTDRIHLRHKSASLAAPGLPAFLSALPGNQVLNIHVHEKQIRIPRLAPAHDGLRIAHLTDLHMSGRLTQSFFEHVVEAVNNTNPDLIAITGDIVEGDRFLSWLPPTLGQLKARDGVYYILGNHDRRSTESRIKAVLKESGLIHVGDNWREVIVNGSPLIIAGNELPWYKPAADLSSCKHEAASPTRILLAHSPDQFKWAQQNGIDLMLAGHLHGGQIRFPILGAITSPSLHGVRYAAGIFTAGNTVLHVSRGVSALTPLRVNCPPEIATLVLHGAT
jgi:predicted MPP superfamily phosphohydrolase